MPRNGWKTITVPEYVYNRFKKEYDEKKEEYHLKFGISSFSAFIAKLLSERLEKLERKERPRLEHLNVYEDHVKIVDNVMNRIASVYFNGKGKVYCDVCDVDSCIHVDYAIGLPEVKEALDLKGWKKRREL